ncbi:MAG: ATP-dependent Clp protease adaptor ClpS [Spirochaetales bacterium]|nr:ATP-dependent Clp protease adaptor ClpS [Spirochaetales bacterium]
MSSKEILKTIEQNDTDLDLREPSMFTVVMHNDHYTTMEFVVNVLIDVFQKDYLEAERIMTKIHEQGKSNVAAYPFDIARTKVQVVHDLAKEAGFPLKCTCKKVGV